ncbi:MAG TPA: flagellar filament capping protein FliD [Legionella sp.]|nr:flagellar filament capping protein FliD [Legionella sp.]
MSLSTPGIGSGLDIKAMVDAYVKAEITPLQTRHDNKLSSVNTELSAIGQLKSVLSNLQTSLANLSDINKFYNMKYSVSDSDYFTATVTPEANKGTYQVEVQKLAQQQSLASAYLNTASIGSGTVTINFGSYNNDKTVFTINGDATPVSINIAPGSDSLVGVRDAINNSESGLTASIIQDNQGSRLTITSAKTGENYAMQISGSLTALNYDPTIGSNALTETIAAQNSVIKVNGLTLNQSTNQLKDAISGITLNLKKAELSKTITLNVDDNKDQLTGLVNDFIKKYNDSTTLLTNLTGYNSSTKQSGLFQGDPQFRNLKLNLNKWATSPLTHGNGAIQSLADMGITTNKQGLLELKMEKYNKVLESNYGDIGSFFAKTATASDSNIRIKSVGTEVKSGTYNVDLSEFTPGVSMQGTIGALPATSSDGITLKGSGDLKDLSVDVLSGSIGARGSIVVKDGLAVLMNGFLNTYMGTTGDLSQRADQLNKQITQLDQAQKQIDTRSASIESRYFKQFNALDLLLSKLQATSSSLTQQLANLPQLKLK